MIKKIDKILHAITTGVSIVTHISFLTIMVVIVVDVLLRKIANTGIMGAYEIVQMVLSAGVFAGFAYCQSEHGHVHVTLLISHFPQKVRFLVFGLLSILSTAAAFYLSHAAMLAMKDQYAKLLKGAGATGVVGIPYWPFYLIEVICMFIFGVVLAWDTIKNFIAMGNKEVAEEIQATWS